MEEIGLNQGANPRNFAMNTAAWRAQEAEENRRLQKLLGKLLRESGLNPAQKKGQPFQILDIACGECREAETLIKVAQEFQSPDSKAEVRLIGTDIRNREVEDAARRFRSRKDAKFEFLVENASRLDRNKEIGQDLDMAFIRHQNFWLDGTEWKRIFEQGLAKLSDEGLLVITSYFDREHELAKAAIAEAGGELIVTERNLESIELAIPGKSVDRHVAVFRRKK